MVERLDVNRDYIIDTNDLTIVKNINLGVVSSETLTYQNTANLPTQEAIKYYKYNATTGAYTGEYTLSTVNSISTSSSSISTYSILDGVDDRWAEDGLDGVLCIDNGNGGTAFVVDSHTLITAAHCLMGQHSSSGSSSQALSNLEFKVCDKYGETSAIPITPIEYQIPQKFVTNTNSSEYSKYDYAIVTISQDLSDYINFNLGVVRNELYTTNANSKKLLFITGFGGYNDKANEELINIKSTGDGFLTSTPTSYRLFYDIDTIGGDSGGPVYANVNGKKTVLAVHTSGGNSGIRLTTNILNLIYNHQ